MQIKDLKAVTYWRKTYPVEAIRLTEHNIQTVADFLGAEYCTKSKDDHYISYGGEEGCAGEWLVKEDEGYLFFSHEEFVKAFKTHAEEMSTNERYAKVFLAVATLASRQDAATFQGDTTGMDLLIIETTKKILGEL